MNPDRQHYLHWAHAGRPALWRYAVAVFLAFLAWVWGSVPIVFVIQAFGFTVLNNPVAFLYTFLGGFFGLLLITRFLMGRPGWSIALSEWPPKVWLFAIGVAMQFVIMLMLSLANASLISWQGFNDLSIASVALAFAALVGLLIQTGFEEAFFRGLLLQATFRFIRWAPIVIGLQAVFFASIHAGNVSQFDGNPWANLPYFASALGLGWIAWRTGSLLLPIGLHFMNNVFLVFFIETRGDVLTGLAPMVTEITSMERVLMFSIGQAVLAVAGTEILVRRGFISAPERTV